MSKTADTVVLSRWHGPTLVFLWLVALAFVAASCYINEMYARAFGANPMFHAIVPGVVLVAALVVEFLTLSEAHGWARWIAVLVAFVVFAIALAISYLAIMEMVFVWSPHLPRWLLQGAAGIPDGLTLAAGTGIVSLRVKGRAAKPSAPVEARGAKPPSLRARLAEAATARAEAALAVKPPRVAEVPNPQVAPSVEARGGAVAPVAEAPAEAFAEWSPTFAEPGAEGRGGVGGGSVERVAEVAEPSTEPVEEAPAEVPPRAAKTFVEAGVAAHIAEAEALLAAGAVTRKTPVEVAAVLAAIERGDSDNAIKTAGLASAGTVGKLRAARNGAPLAAVGG